MHLYLFLGPLFIIQEIMRRSYSFRVSTQSVNAWKILLLLFFGLVKLIHTFSLPTISQSCFVSEIGGEQYLVLEKPLRGHAYDMCTDHRVVDGADLVAPSLRRRSIQLHQVLLLPSRPARLRYRRKGRRGRRLRRLPMMHRKCLVRVFRRRRRRLAEASVLFWQNLPHAVNRRPSAAIRK